jgi:hypothetical protein
MSQKILVIDDNLGSSKLAESVLSQHFNGGDVLVAQRRRMLSTASIWPSRM